MSIKHWLVATVLIAVSGASLAQQKARPMDPSDPKASVPTYVYESAFNGYLSARELDKTPDAVWRSANQEMAILGGHAGHIKDVNVPTSKAVSDPAPTDHSAHQKKGK